MENILIKIPEHAENIIKKLQKTASALTSLVDASVIRCRENSLMTGIYALLLCLMMSCVSLQMKRSYLPD